jgi:AcrR family transcriptional regulator
VTARRNTAEGSARTEAVTSILDAAEALLVAEGQRAVTTRRLSEQAGVNHGLVHYYFGSMDEVMMQTFERFTARLIVRQRTMYAADVPFLQKWRMAMSYLDEDLAAGYPKVWMELQALGWNRPDMRERVAAMTGEWRGVLTDAFGKAAAEYHLDPDLFPVDALVSLVMTFNQGLLLERLSGISEGHRELLRWVDDWLVALEAGK